MWPSRPGSSMLHFGTTFFLARNMMKKGLSELFADFCESLVILGPSVGKRNAECSAAKAYGSFWSLPLSLTLEPSSLARGHRG